MRQRPRRYALFPYTTLFRSKRRTTNMDDIRYPIGPCVWPAEVSADERRRHIRDIAEMPSKLRQAVAGLESRQDRKSTRLNSSHTVISYAVFCLKKKKTTTSY